MTLIDDRPTVPGETPLVAPRWPLLHVLAPREHTAMLAAALTVSVGAAWLWGSSLGRPLWQSVAVFLVLMAAPLAVKWRADARRVGTAAATAGALVVVQSLHGVEHAYQWTQRHLLDMPLRRSNGLLSPANTEWVHFVWNWLVLAVVVFLVVKGMRGWWALLFLGWVVAHTLEHTYMMIRYIEVMHDLRGYGFPKITSQGLPGVLGNDGWIDRNVTGTRFSFICNIPFATTATRLDTHAMWNVGETLLMLPAVHVFLRRVLGQRATG